MPEFAPLFDVKTPASLPPEAARPAAESGKPLRLGGLTPLTTIDFPGRLAAVLYCQGCPWRCTYCHNTELLDAATPPALPWPDALAFLHRRRGLLDGVVFSGGEPTLQTALADALAAVRALGMQTALHTAGMYPQRLAALLPQLDWVGWTSRPPRTGTTPSPPPPAAPAVPGKLCARWRTAASTLNVAPPGTRACSAPANCWPWLTNCAPAA